MRRILLALAAILFAGSAHAQFQPSIAGTSPFVTMQSPTRLDAGQQVQYNAGSINQSQATLTIPAMSGQCAYIDSLVVGLGMDATGTTGVQSFTTTNLGGLGWSFYPIVASLSNYSQQLVGATPLKAASCGIATTIVSPAQSTHNAYPMTVVYHYAP